MDVEKRSSKGGFLHLFDWNVKSKKKLFSNKSDDGSTKGKENAANSTMLQSQLMETGEDELGRRGKISYDYDYASSPINDEGYGTRAPGVVARLMGLDRLPTSANPETPYYDSSFLKDSYSQRSDFRIEDQIIYNVPKDKTSRNLVESRLQRVHNMPIERFQTEAAPPRSAKSMPITHHRLLSPIKTPGFIQTNNVAYIMEAAARIIEQGSPSVTRTKMAYFRSTSVPLRIKDLREKMAVDQKPSTPRSSQRAKEHISFNHNKEHANGMNHRRSGNKQVHNSSATDVNDGSDSGKRKGKSVSLAVQAKVNIQRREGSTSSGNRSSVNSQRKEGLTAYGNRSSIRQKEDNQISLGQFSKNQMNTQRSVQKRTSRSRAPDVLKQNDQKQNNIVNRDRVASKALVSNQNERKPMPNNGCLRPNKASNKASNMATGPRKMNPATKVAAAMEPPVKRNASGENRPVQNDMRLSEGSAKNTKMNKDESPVERIISNGGCLNWDLVDRKSGTDVVSFTFTSPIKRAAAPGLHSPHKVVERNTDFAVDCYEANDPQDLKNRNLSTVSVNLAGRDALSVLLEQKLKELTCRVESSEGNSEASNAACSGTSKEEFASTPNIRNTSSTGHRSSFHLNLHDNDSNYRYYDDCSSSDSLLLKAKEKCQRQERLEETEENSCSSNNDYGKELDCGHSSPISNLEPSSSYGSYESSDSKTSSVSYGLFSSEANGMMDGMSGRRRQIAKVEMELSDSASSSSTPYFSGLTSTGFRKCQHPELEYIAKILCYSGLTFEDLVLGRVKNALTPKLFNHLEKREARRDEYAEQCPELARKLLFESVIECLESYSEQLQTRSSEAWFKYSTLFRRKEKLAEELYKEISSWDGMGDLLVDELVDKDMSSRRGKWVEFETEVFEEGIEIEKEILDSLVDELVADLLLI